MKLPNFCFKSVYAYIVSKRPFGLAMYFTTEADMVVDFVHSKKQDLNYFIIFFHTLPIFLGEKQSFY